MNWYKLILKPNKTFTFFLKLSKLNIAIFLALLFHISGAIGILCTPYKQWFIQNTPLNLLLMAGLLFYTQKEKNTFFYLFAFIAFITGMLTEIIGVNTSLLFGNYSYAEVMGIKIKGVPLLIGIQWFVAIFCSGSVVHQSHVYLEKKYQSIGIIVSPKLQFISIIFDGAALATFFDYVMEPVAIKLNFWQWQNNVIPMYNYVCWFIISLILLIIFRLLPFNKANHFAIHLFIIQILFFIALRIFL